MSHHNEMEVRFLSLPENEAFARVVIAAFAVQLSPTVSEIADIKTAVSEAVTNAAIASVLFIIAWDTVEYR